MSNPRQCQHSMVTDLCGMCIRDMQIDLLVSAMKAIKDGKDNPCLIAVEAMKKVGATP